MDPGRRRMVRDVRRIAERPVDDDHDAHRGGAETGDKIDRPLHDAPPTSAGWRSRGRPNAWQRGGRSYGAHALFFTLGSRCAASSLPVRSEQGRHAALHGRASANSASHRPELGRLAARFPARARSQSSGSPTLTRVPSPTRLRILISPPCSRTRPLTIDNPKPGSTMTPVIGGTRLKVRLADAREVFVVDADAVVLDHEGDMPASARALTVTLPPRSVKRIAFEMRLSKI